MKLEEILQEMEKDSEIEKDRLDHESLKTPKLHSKWLKIYSGEKRVLNQLKTQLVQLTKEKEEYYGGKSDASVYREKPFHLKLLKGDIPKYISSDPDIVKITSAIDVQDEKVYIIQEYIKQINQRGYSIKAALDFMRWTSGN